MFIRSITALLAILTVTYGCAQSGKTVSPANDAYRIAAINPADAKLLAIHLIKPRSASPIILTSTDFKNGGEIPYTFSDYGDRISPQLNWSGVPSDAKSLVLLMEDPDAQLPKPFIHWVLFNLPASTTSLRQAIPGQMQLVEFANTPQGLNSRGSIGYMGPRPPYNDAAHHYHFQIFALDTTLDLSAGIDRATLLNAMKDHVIATGSVVGTYKAAK